MRVWTEDQLKAIEADNHDTLVSAAAGSGKSTVLIEHVLRLLRAGGEVTRLLIITFTRAAAAELRDKMERALDAEAAQNRHMREQLRSLKRAQISTLHVFCHNVIKTHFQACGADPNARIGSDPQLAPLRLRALSEAVEQMCASSQEDDRLLRAQFEDEEIVDMAEKLYGFIMMQPEPWEWLDTHKPSTDPASLRSLQLIFAKEALMQLEGARAYIQQMEAQLAIHPSLALYTDSCKADFDLISEAMASVRAMNSIQELKFATLTRATKKNAPDPAAKQIYTDFREEAKNCFKKAQSLVSYDLASETSRIADTVAPANALCRLVRNYADRYAVLKRQRGLMDYNDLEHLCIEALKDDRVRAEVAASYDAIFVDEYQDVSGIEEGIVRMIHTESNRLFMVGDVKQSIYRFRQADPSLFLGKYESFSKEADGTERKIVLSQNFRSNKNILDAVNCVFKRAMRKTGTPDASLRSAELDYDKDAELNARKDAEMGPAVELHLIGGVKKDDEQEKPSEDSAENEELTRGWMYEAQQAARRIKQLVGQPYQNRKLQWRDFVLLVRQASGRSETIARILQNEGIPCFSDADASFYEQREVEDMVNLIRVLDNPYQDLPLLAALRTPCFGFSSERLAEISQKCAKYAHLYEGIFALRETEPDIAHVLDTLDRWRFLSDQMTVDALLRHLLRETGIYALAGAERDGRIRQANLRLLCERAQDEGARYSLFDFLRNSEAALHSSDKTTAKELSEKDDVVRIMTIHKSKGLEFPVVFVMEMARTFRGARSGDTLRIDQQLGLSLKWVDAEERVADQTLGGRAIAERAAREDRAEEARLLYVAMTRARDRLILLASPKSLDSARKKWRLPPGDYASGCATSMLEWVGQAIEPALTDNRDQLYTALNGSLWDVRFHDESEYHQELPGDHPVALPALDTDFNEQFLRRMHPSEKPHHRQKTSVTRLAHETALKEEEDETADTKRRPLELSRALPPLPDFMKKESGLSAADRGTAMHRVLGLLDLSKVRDIASLSVLDQTAPIRAELERMLSLGLLTQPEYDALQSHQIAAFLLSPLGQRMLHSPQVHREWPFYMMPEDMLIQGVIDLCFREGDGWVLADYKTDRCDGAELYRRYAEQLRWYGRALSTITGLPVRELWLFSLRSGKAIAVEGFADP